jgi:hypothetical protein
MKAKSIKMPKTDVEKFSEKQLEDLIGWGNHPGYTVMLDVAEDALQRKVMELTDDSDMGDDERLKTIESIALMKLALDFLFDAGNRAKEELKRRNK